VGGDRARFVGERLTLQPLLDLFAGLVDDPLAEQIDRASYAQTLRHVERTAIVRGLLVLSGGPRCRFRLGVVPRGEGNVLFVRLG